MSNASPDQNRSLKPTLSGHPTHSTYSASPSQLTLQSDMPSGPLPQTYHPYQHVPQYDPNAFQFSQPSYRPQPQLQTRHPQVPPPPHMTTPQQQLPSPTISRKRRASELSGDSVLPSSSVNNLGGYSNPTGLMGPPPPSDMDPSGQASNQQLQQHQHQQSQMPPPPQPLPQVQQQQQQQQQNNQTPGPVVKKGRTNTPWTPSEEHRLKQLRDQGSSWSEIAKNFPNRTEGSLKKHWYKDMHYADFGADESTALLQAIKEYETNKWKVIGQKVGKPAKACEQFAKEQGWKV